MRDNGSYTLEIMSYVAQGTQVNITRKYSMPTLASAVVILSSAVYVFIFKDGITTMQKCIVFSVVFITILYFIQMLSKVHKETLLILSDLGVMVKRQSLLSSKTRYYDMQHIEDIVIIEAVSMHSVICQLVLLPKKLTTGDKNDGRLYPLFQTFQPSLEDLKTIYRHVHTGLVPSDQLQDR